MQDTPDGRRGHREMSEQPHLPADGGVFDAIYDRVRWDELDACHVDGRPDAASQVLQLDFAGRLLMVDVDVLIMRATT